MILKKEREFVLEFSSVAEFDSFFKEADDRGYFHLQAEDLPSDATFRARCVDSPRTRRIRPLAIKRIRDGYEVQISETANQPAGSEETGEDVPDAMRISPNDKIRAMTVSDRVTLALKADLIERRILVKENNPKIHEFLLRNTRITDQEIAFMARNPSSPMQTILAIANRKDWMGREVIRSAILVNPRTPPNIVHEMIPMASSQDILKMFNSKNLREDIQSTVRLEMKKRGLRLKKVAE